jgi:hypothetical protein
VDDFWGLVDEARAAANAQADCCEVASLAASLAARLPAAGIAALDRTLGA